MAWRRELDGRGEPERNIYRRVDPTTGAVSKFYYVKVSVRGVPRWIPTKTASIVKARLIRDSKVVDVARGAPDVARAVTVDRLLDVLEDHYRLNGKLTADHVRDLQLFRAEFGPLHPAELVSVEHGDRIERLQARLKAAGTVSRGGRRLPITNAAINRRCAVLRRALSLGQEKQLILAIPKVRKLNEKDERNTGRDMTPAVIDALEAALPPWHRPYFRYATEVGTRRGQLARTRAAWVDLERGWIAYPASECKEGEPATIPLCGRALAIVRVALATSHHSGCLFLFHGQRCLSDKAPRASRAIKTGGLRSGRERWGCIGDITLALEAAARRAGLPYGLKAGGYTFHSTRHAAVTLMDAGGLTVPDIMKFTQHRTSKMVRHYNHQELELLKARREAAGVEVDRQRRERGEAVPDSIGQHRTVLTAGGGRLRAVENGRQIVDSGRPARKRGRVRS